MRRLLASLAFALLAAPAPAAGAPGITAPDGTTRSAAASGSRVCLTVRQPAGRTDQQCGYTDFTVRE